MEHVVGYKNHLMPEIPTKRVEVYKGQDKYKAQQEYNSINRVIDRLLPEDHIVTVYWWVDEQVEAGNTLIRPFCDHCGHFVDHRVRRWKETQTFLCQQHWQEMLAYEANLI